VTRDTVNLAVLYTTGAEPDWPDVLDVHTGVFTYFGDNRSPGRELHDTQRKGNLLLSRVFERAHPGTTGTVCRRSCCSTSLALVAMSGSGDCSLRAPAA